MSADLRGVLSRFATGVTVVTAGGPLAHGMTANSFTSVSLDPPTVLCCVARAARLHDAITSAGAFAVSILAAEQRDVAAYFADRSRPAGPAQFDAVACTPGARTGAPLVDGALAWVECSLARTDDGGTHSIVLGTVLSHGLGSGGSALSFFGGTYHDLAPGPGVPGADAGGHPGRGHRARRPRAA